jgi:hypothetical protein
MGLMRLRGLLLGLVGVLVLGLPGVALAGGGQGCPNEALRVELGSGFLPDCRAYEMVTPAYKEGYEFFSAAPGAFSSDGDRVFMASVGGVAGIEGEGEEVLRSAVYMDTRTASGWKLEPVMAPLGGAGGRASFIGPIVIAVEANRGLSLWRQHRPDQSATTNELYVRSASGVYSLVGPLSTPAQAAGGPSDASEVTYDFAFPLAVTSDYSHVVMHSGLFDVNIPVAWPFDEQAAAGKGNLLYEYSGTGNREPILVGVTGPRGSTQIVGDCGTGLGSGNAKGGSGSAYNALSSDGETVFFTSDAEGCGTAELWARRHGSLLSALPAESVDVSARAPEPACTGACRSSVESGKEFEGASENSERVFFTSTQQLLNGASQDPEANDDAYNPRNGFYGCSVTTGVGGCNLYEYDFNAAAGDNPRLVAGGAEVLGVARIAEDGSRVYFVAKGVLTGRANGFGALPVAGEPNLYVFDPGEAERDPGYRPVFVATLSPSDRADWNRDDERPVQATPDGRFLVFPSSRPGLTPGDTATTEQLFEYDAQTGELVRISQGEDGYNDNGNNATAGVIMGPLVTSFFEEHDTTFRTSTNINNVSDDGMTVVFDSAGRLSALASSAELGCASVYEYRGAGSIADGGVHLLSDGADEQPSQGEECEGARFQGMDAEGENILFSTADPLLASDTDGLRDLYDARAGGGFALPSVPVGCVGEGCLGAPAVPPGLAGAGSTASSGGGNLPSVVSPVVVKVGVRSLTRAQKLARALRACRGEPRRRRVVCETRARKRYAVVSRVSGANGRGKR